jgi:hypothetical protein
MQNKAKALNRIRKRCTKNVIIKKNCRKSFVWLYDKHWINLTHVKAYHREYEWQSRVVQYVWASDTAELKSFSSSSACDWRSSSLSNASSLDLRDFCSCWTFFLTFSCHARKIGFGRNKNDKVGSHLLKITTHFIWDAVRNWSGSKINLPCFLTVCMW